MDMMPVENFTGTVKNMEVLSVIHIASSSSSSSFLI
jgi:hypothetical protein